MMAGWLSTFAAALAAWSVRLLDVSWQAGLVAAAAWAVCRLFPRMPAHIRATLWWLVCAKFIVGLAWIQPIALPVLPATAGDEVAADADADAATRALAGIAPGRSVGDGGSTASGISTGVGTGTGTGIGTVTLSAPMVLGGIWICGALLQLALTCLAYRLTRALVRDSTPADAPIAQLAHALSERIGGVGRVDVRLSASIDTPRVTGAFSPIILLPAAANQLSRADLEMTLCHELLHVRRGDLALGWLPALAQCAFFFHPCMWIAMREYTLAREAACDAAVLRVLGAEPDAYGALLLRLGITHTDIAPIAVGASSSFRTLKRRLLMLQHASEKARTHAARWWIVAGAAALLIVPLRLVAQTASPAAKPAAAKLAAAKENEQSEKSEKAEKIDIQRMAERIYHSWRDAWVLLHAGDDNVSMSGSTNDIAEAGRQRERPGEPLLWFRHNGQAYVIRDPETLHAVEQMFEPMQHLGDQQGALGNQQGRLGDQQGKLGDQQGALGNEMSKLARQLELLNADQLELTAKEIRNGDAARADLKAERAKVETEMKRLTAQMESLGRQQEELGRQQEALGREQEKFGRQQEALGRQQEEAGKQAERQIRELLEHALATGIAKPAR